VTAAEATRSGVSSSDAAVVSTPPPATGPAFLSRREQFRRVGSTNDVVRGWLTDGVAEVCLAVADEQTAGRGREGRRWIAPPGAALLLSLGLRPVWLPSDGAWRIAAVVALAMADAAIEVAGLPAGSVALKWPNDLVVEDAGPRDPRPGILRKLAGLLGETDGLGSAEPLAIIGIGVNVDWSPTAFPVELAAGMTSLRELAGDRHVDRSALLEAFLSRLDPQVVALRAGRFDGDEWAGRQVTTGRDVTLELADGGRETVRAVGVDPLSGALLVGQRIGPRQVFSAEIRHVRLAGHRSRGEV
jgi:BirA family transcriptional regulator, biotin operon repressor / biotin---[acetyl-CoA-carboxylase] ligase